MSSKDLMIPSSLLAKSLKYAFKECVPLVATIEIIQHCNFKCSHCYNFDRAHPMPEKLKNSQMTDEQIIGALDQLSEMGSLFINFSGGEAALHPSIEKFITHTTNLHLQSKLKSNGASLDFKKISKLKECGLSGVDISLYGATEKTYKGFTGKENSFNQTIQGIKNCLKIGLDTNISIILHGNNAGELSQMIKLCKDLKVSFQIQTEVTERYDKSQGAAHQSIDNSQFIDLLTGPHQDYFKYKNEENAFQCACARSVCGISSSGDVFPCIGAPIKAGNLKEEKFRDIWENSEVFLKIRGLTKEDFSSCISCDHSDYCNRSSGGVYVNTGDYTGCDPATYAQSKIRHEISESLISL